MSEPLNQRVAAEVNQILKLGDYLERPEAGNRLRDEAQLWRGKETTIVIAGEPNRGKSSLLNALLGRVVLPTGTDLATTTTHVIIRHGAPETARIHLMGRADPIEVPLDDAGPWILGSEGGDGGVRGVELRIDHPLLAAGLALVDTPGVGGLDAAHGRITLTALRRADAMVFVADADAPISEPELEFLDAATDRIESVAVCVTKVDRYRGWRTIVDDDRARLSSRVPRFASAPMFPVSARLKLLADAAAAEGAPDPSMVAESGVPELERFVTADVVGQVALLRLANLLRVADVTLVGLAEAAQTTLAASTGVSGAREAAEQLQAQLERLREASEAGHILVTDRCNAVRERLSTELQRELREITTKFEQPGDSKQTAVDLATKLEAELTEIDVRLTDQIDVEIAEIRRQVEEMVDEPTFAFPGFEGERDPLAIEVPAPAGEPEPTKRDMGTTLRVASGVVASGFGGFLLTTGAGQVAANGFGAGGGYSLMMGTSMLIGAVTTFTGLHNMRRQKDLTAARKAVAQIVENARGEASPRLRQRVLDLQRATEAEMKAYSRRRTRELQDAIAEANQLARSDAAARQQAQTAAQERLDLIDRHRDAVAGLAGEVLRYSMPPGTAAEPEPAEPPGPVGLD